MIVNESIKYLDTNKIKSLYHWVQTENQRDFVLKNGIKSDSDGYIYLSQKPFNETHPSWRGKGFVFKVRIPDNNKLYDWREFWCDNDGNELDSDHQYDPKNPYFIYMGDIDKKYIQEI